MFFQVTGAFAEFERGTRDHEFCWDRSKVKIKTLRQSNWKGFSGPGGI